MRGADEGQVLNGGFCASRKLFLNSKLTALSPFAAHASVSAKERMSDNRSL